MHIWDSDRSVSNFCKRDDTHWYIVPGIDIRRPDEGTNAATQNLRHRLLIKLSFQPERR
jgi:hypothetical protein